MDFIRVDPHRLLGLQLIRRESEFGRAVRNADEPPSGEVNNSSATIQYLDILVRLGRLD